MPENDVLMEEEIDIDQEMVSHKELSMHESYKRIGDYIRLVDERNRELEELPLMGISITKKFIPSVANIVGTDLANYKIIQKFQFACSLMQVSRDGKIPVAMMEDEAAIMSPAYPMFEVIDHEKLLPGYLMMWFERSEFDREAAYYAIGGIRGNLTWEDFCDMTLPVPTIEKQKEIVKEYKIIQDRIELNNQLIQKLEETARAVYREWFVEFEFPDENGKPYKSSGGRMAESEFGEIPKGWVVGTLGDIIDVVNGYAFGGSDFYKMGDFPIIKIANIVSPNIELETAFYYKGELNNSMKKSIIQYGDILISMTGSHINQMNSAVGKIGRYNYPYPAILNQRVGKLKPKFACSEFIYRIMLKDETQKEILMSATGSANQANISPDTIKSVKIVNPERKILKKYDELIHQLNRNVNLYQSEIRKLENFKSLLLSKFATVEN